MLRKSKFEYEMEEFNNGFAELTDKRIVIYGTGRMTATLIEYNDRYNIIGLCDRDPAMIGTKVYGVEVVSQEYAEQNGDLLIINTASSYWSAIYKRIQNWNIPIYFRDGKKAMLKGGADADDPYWNTSMDELREHIENAEIVSFDIFDTLIMRKCMSPTDVYSMVENALCRTLGDKAKAYTDARKKAASVNDNPTFEQIYDELQTITRWNDEDIALAKATEVDVEKAITVPRKDIVTLFNKVCKEKEVYLISDMYFSTQVIREILLSAGINCENVRIFISCELGRDKVSGNLWDWYATEIVKGKRAFHVGDNIVSDYKKPMEYGIDAYHILNAYDMLCKSSISEIEGEIVSLYSSIVMGILCTRICNSPFALNKTKGKICFESDEDAGFAVYGAFSYSFIMWLISQAKCDGITKLAFLARDGYLLKKQYELIEKLMKEDVPEPIYLETSRRVIYQLGVTDRESLLKVASYPYKGNAGDFLLDRFGVKLTDTKLHDIDITELQNDKESFGRFIIEYEDLLLQRAENERNNYLEYLRRVGIDAKTALVDTLLYGTIQYYMGHALDIRFIGYYMCCKLDEDNEYLPYNIMRGCFQESDDPGAERSAVKEYGDYVESFFTAPNGMTLHFDDAINPVYAEKMSNQKHFDVRIAMNTGVEQFIEEMMSIANLICDNVYEFNDTYFVGKLLGCYAKEGFEPTENMRNGFYYDNGVANRLESPIWL